MSSKDDSVVQGAEQIASLQEIHKTIQVITVRGWIALVFGIAFFTSALVWAFLGSLPLAVEGKCVLLEKSPKNYVAYGFFPLFSGEQITPGMQVSIALDAKGPSSGKIKAKVREVIPYPVDAQSPALQPIPSESLRKYLVEGKVPTMLVIIDPILDPKDHRLKWTLEQSALEELSSLSIGEAQVILKTIRPISYVIPEI